MELKIKPATFNSFPLQGILLKGVNLKQCLHWMQNCGISIPDTQIYPLPTKDGNQLWGYLISGVSPTGLPDLGPYCYCQLLYEILYVPEYCLLHPHVSAEELKSLLGMQPHFLHPEIGFVELPPAINWTKTLKLPTAKAIQITVPKSPLWIPQRINSLQVRPKSFDETMQTLGIDEKTDKTPKNNKPLSLFEKLRHQIYRIKFNSEAESTNTIGHKIKKVIGSLLFAPLAMLPANKKNIWNQTLKLDYEELEKRSNKNVDKLLQLFKKDPEKALKHATPINNDANTSRGHQGYFDFSLKWFNFSLFENSNYASRSSSGNAIVGNNKLLALQQQYEQTAKELIKSGDHAKAAFIYIKLLKYYQLGASTLAEGKLYAEAANIYTQLLNDKNNAANCYELGNMTEEAISIYKELHKYEKVGDLYIKLHNDLEAHKNYQLAADQHIKVNNHDQAAKIFWQKMNDVAHAREILKSGWRSQTNLSKNIKTYFSTFDNPKELNEEIKTWYKYETNYNNRLVFLRQIKTHFHTYPSIAETIKDITYEIVSLEAVKNPNVVEELLFLQPNNNHLLKDTMRYKSQFN